MKLTGFRITMFKGVTDSGLVDVDDLTVLVGKNEAGKTTLLKALHKLNPATPDPYNIEREWPRGRRAERNKEQVICTARFDLDATDFDALRRLTDQTIELRSLEVTRTYGNVLAADIPEDAFPHRLHPDEIERLAQEVPEPPEGSSAGLRTAAERAKDELLAAAGASHFDDLQALLGRQKADLTAACTQAEPQNKVDTDWVAQYAAKLKELVRDIPKRTIWAQAQAYIARAMPKFIYMDDYRAFEGSAILNQVKERREASKLTTEDETFLMILALSGLDLNGLVAAGEKQDREQRQYDLEDGGRTLTKLFGQRLKQREYEVAFRADGQEFFTMVKDTTEVGLLKLEERSKGFQWFFSFDLLFMHESGGTFQNCVLLLDEPGLHLHPGAQTDLLARLEEYAKGNTLVYSTHLPFMLDLQHPERIRVINDSATGAVVTEDLTESQPEAKLTLQAALGMSGRSSYLLAQKNLVVEGADDYFILSALSDLLGRSGSEALPEDVMITPGGGASEAAYIATFMIGQGLDVVVLLDSDGAGEAARAKLVKNWLTKYKGKESQVLCLGDVLEPARPQFAIEDLFPDEFYLARVEEVYHKQLATCGDPKLTLVGGGQLCKRVERALQDKGIKLNKGSVAKRLRRDVSRMKDATELPEQARRFASTIFSRVASALA